MEMQKTSITKLCLKLYGLKLLPHLSEGSELILSDSFYYGL